MADPINGDLSVRVVVDTARMEWVPSPGGSVLRKRVHLVGPSESGQVTSVVLYEPHSTFPAHDHPDGEEILVLDGVFSDEHGNWPAGTYLLNPEGFRHTPFSELGCTLFVKLRQFAGHGRRHMIVDTRKLPWEATPIRGVTQKLLYEQVGFSDVVLLEHWNPETDAGTNAYEQGAELFVLEGEFTDEAGAYAAGYWLRLPAGSRHHPRTTRGCILYVKKSGLQYLESAVAQPGTS
ncbi:MAG TPA: cupin domain-containing protein [Casimicrobiaceae bacterium]|nr:cupin domain-containing protein [Casimicrobiaceae bacterium]